MSHRILHSMLQCIYSQQGRLSYQQERGKWQWTLTLSSCLLSQWTMKWGIPPRQQMLGKTCFGPHPFQCSESVQGESHSPTLWLLHLLVSSPVQFSAFTHLWYEIATLSGICTSLLNFSYGCEVLWKADYYSTTKISFGQREETLSHGKNASSLAYPHHVNNCIIMLILILNSTSDYSNTSN